MGKLSRFLLMRVCRAFGFAKGSKEGGVAQGIGCQKNAFKRQLQLATAYAMGVSDDKLEILQRYIVQLTI